MNATPELFPGLERPTSPPPAARPLFRAEFFVPGEPKPQPRARSFAVRGAGGKVVMKQGPRGPEPIIRVFDPGTAEGWKSAIAQAAIEHRPEKPLEVPVCLRVRFIIPRPGYMRTRKYPPGEFWHASRTNRAGDVENYVKALMDALTVVGFWSDDGFVAKLVALKVYAELDGPTGAVVTIEELADPDGFERPAPKHAPPPKDVPF